MLHVYAAVCYYHPLHVSVTIIMKLFLSPSSLKVKKFFGPSCTRHRYGSSGFALPQTLLNDFKLDILTLSGHLCDAVQHAEITFRSDSPKIAKRKERSEAKEERKK